MKLVVIIALRNLIQARRRSALLFSALFLVTLLLVGLMSLSRGLTETMLESATTVSSGHVNVGGFFKTRPQSSGALIDEVSRLRKIVADNTPGLAYQVDRVRGWAKVISPTHSLQSGISGIDIADEQAFLDRIVLAPRSAYVEDGDDEVRGDPRGLAEPDTALIFAAQAKRLEVEVGDVLTLTSETMEGQTNTGEVRIVAIAKDFGFLSNWSVFVPKDSVRKLYSMDEDTSGVVQLHLEDEAQSQAVMAHLREVFTKEGFEVMDHEAQPFWMKFDRVSGEDWVGQRLDLTVWEDEVSFLQWAITGVDFVAFFLVLILAVIIIMGIMNTMWIAVRERTAEVGTLRAIGMSSGRIRSMFMVEALLLALAATGSGATVGVVLVSAVDAAQFVVPYPAVRAVLMSDVLHLSISAGQLLGAVLLFTCVTAVGAIWPAVRASKLSPMAAISKVG